MRPNKSVQNGQNDIDQPVEPVEADKECVTLRTPREVVEQWFADYPNLGHLSNREIAKRCGVTEGTVRNYKKELEERQRAVQTLLELAEPTIEPEPEPTQQQSRLGAGGLLLVVSDEGVTP